MPTAANNIEHRPHPHKGSGELQTMMQKNANSPQAHYQLTYAAATNCAASQTTTLYKPTTFHTVARDNTYTYPFENIPHLLITGRYRGTILPKNEIVF
jgi:hypothetical protein